MNGLDHSWVPKNSSFLTGVIGTSADAHGQGFSSWLKGLKGLKGLEGLPR